MSRASSWFRGRTAAPINPSHAETTAAEPRRPFGATLMSLCGTVIDVVRTRFSLLALEIAEEKARIPKLLGLALGAMISVVLGLLVLSAWVLVYFWDTHRLAAFLMMGFSYLGLGIILALSLKRSLSGPSLPFEATLAELEKDAAWLRSLGKSMEPAETPKNPGTPTRSESTL